MKISLTDFLNQIYVLTYNVWNTLKSHDYINPRPPKAVGFVATP